MNNDRIDLVAYGIQTSDFKTSTCCMSHSIQWALLAGVVFKNIYTTHLLHISMHVSMYTGLCGLFPAVNGVKLVG